LQSDTESTPRGQKGIGALALATVEYPAGHNQNRKTDTELPMRDHYAALGLGSDASLTDIKKAFRQKAAIFHPDRNTAADANARFREVQAAYEVLSDETKRQAYDDNRRRNLLDDPLETARDIWQSYIKAVL
jgi:hypothetical protein